ncbi:hypothetical protein HRbin19_00172 [bacterium HR19]|nr:hypothetical protein HRbin19_00172 [bacterium HR19]
MKGALPKFFVIFLLALLPIAEFFPFQKIKCPFMINSEILKPACRERININCIKQEEGKDFILFLSSYVKKEQAKEIYNYATENQVKDLKELEKISGIGSKTVQKIYSILSTSGNCVRD